ncbi:MAG TPA: two-component regulator propeller domain-containing protein, partial [Rhodothermales bacterium]|nr:two-component regulator propeller domain-containing protein [Rhodothermales bacterium]
MPFTVHSSRLFGYARLMLTLLAFALAGSATAAAQGQPPSSAVLDPSLRITQYVHDSWQVQDGLPQNSVYAALQTRDGYLWLGTQEGLARFDGLHFQGSEDAGFGSLGNQEVRALMEDREGGLWVGTNGGGVSRLYDGQVETYTTDNGLSSDLIRSLYQDRDGNVWIGTINGGLSRWDGTSFSNYTTGQGLCGNVVLAISEDASGTLWVGTEEGLSRMVDGSFVCEAGANGESGTLVWSLLPARDGSLWIGTDAGLIHRTGAGQGTYTTQDGLCGHAVSALHEDSAGSLWIGTLDGGLCRFRDGQFESYGTAQGLTHDRIRFLFQDREGSLWIGTEGGGLNRLRQGKFAPVTTLEGLSSNEVYTVLEDRRGVVWAGTHGGGLNRIYDGTVTHFSKADGLPSDNVYALHEDARGRLWSGFLGGGLCRFDAPGWRCFSTRDGLSSDNVYALEDGPSGTLWIGTDAGLDQLQNGRISPFTADTSLSGALISALHRDSTGALWIGTYGAGLARIRNGKIDRYTSATGLTSDIVLALYEGAGGIIWLGTQGGGLCRVSDARTACLTAGNGLLSNNILQIEEDLAGNLWLGSNKGILRVDRSELRAAMAGNGTHLHPVLYGPADGLRSSEANGGTQPASWRTRGGRLLFSTMGGIAAIDPARIPTNTLPPPVALQRFLVNGETVPTVAGQVLGPGIKDLSFTYAGLSLAAPDQVHFQYKLDGYDEAWVDADTRREAFYTNLPPGAYRFQVRASNNDGVWSPAVELAAFRLRPHFYQTAWFAALCALAAVLAVFGLYRFRISQLKARGRELERQVEERTHDLRLEKEKTEQAKAVIEEQASRLQELDRFKTRFFANISHEFRTPLTMIVGPLENVLHGTYGPLSDRLRQQAELMLRNGLRLLRLINQLLDLSKLEAGKMELRAHQRDLVPFVEGVVLSCSAFAERKGITLDFSSASESCEVYFEPDKMEKVFFNLLSNALKFTPGGGRVAVTLCELDPQLDGNLPDGGVEIRVTDSGKGIPVEQLPYIFDRFHQVDGSNTREHEGTGIGLSLAREIVLLHGGDIEVESEAGAGAAFIVTLPRGRSHLKPEDLAREESEPELYHEA